MRPSLALALTLALASPGLTLAEDGPAPAKREIDPKAPRSSAAGETKPARPPARTAAPASEPAPEPAAARDAPPAPAEKPCEPVQPCAID